MNSLKERYLIIVLLVCAFILGGILHVSLYGKEFTTCIVQIYYGAVVVIWAMSIQLRITHDRVRNCILLIACMLLLYLVLQVERYNLIRLNGTLFRNIWYWYYVPMIWIPLLFYIISKCIYTSKEQKNNILLILLGIVLCIGFVTNDYHFGAFRIKDMTNPDNSSSYGPIFIIFTVYMACLYVASIINIVRKNQIISIKRLSWVPLVISVVGAAGVVAAETTQLLSVNGIRIWNMTEWYAFVVIGILESCIVIGLIPSNTGYMSLLRHVSVPVELKEKDGRKVISSEQHFSDTEHIQINTFPVLGGEITWAVDMSNIHRLNEQLEKAAEQLQNRINYLQTENNTKEEQETLNSRNRVYDKITKIVFPQLLEVERLLNDAALDKVDEVLPYVSVLNTYIKRRCNMELMKEDMEMLPLSELKLAISESASYLQLCNIQTAVVGSDNEGDYPADEIIRVYEHFESIIEKHISSMSSIMVVITGNNDGINTRIMVDDEPIDEFVMRKEAGYDGAFA